MRQLLGIVSLVLLGLATSCNQSEYHQIRGGNLTIHFADSKHQKKAEELALYFKENELIAAESQDVGLFREKNTWQVRLIALDEKLSLDFNEQKLLNELQLDLSAVVFNNEQVVIQLCNNQFNVLQELE